jgi:ribonuclease HI
MTTPATHAIYVDGSCIGNPGGSMGAGIVIYKDGVLVHEESKPLGHGTNQQAELHAVILAMGLGIERPVIFTDSAYCVGLLEQGWKARANTELVAQARALKAKTGAKIKKVAGHAGVEENERADRLAVHAARQAKAA